MATYTIQPTSAYADSDAWLTAAQATIDGIPDDAQAHDVIFAAGDHIVPASKRLILKGKSNAANPVVRYHGPGRILKDNYTSRTQVNLEIGKNTNRVHRIEIDGSDGLIIEGAGIYSANATPDGLNIHHVTFKNIWSVGGDNPLLDIRRAGECFACTTGVKNFTFSNNTCQDIVNPQAGGGQAYCLWLMLGSNSNNITISNNTFRNVWHCMNLTSFVSDQASKPDNIDISGNVADGIWSSFCEILGGENKGYRRLRVHGNAMRNWRATMRDSCYTWGLSIPTAGTYGTQVYNNLIDGGALLMANPCSGNATWAPRACIEIGGYGSNVFANHVIGGNSLIAVEQPGQDCRIYGNVGGKWAVGLAGATDYGGPKQPGWKKGYTRASSGTGASITCTADAGGKIVSVQIASGGSNYKATINGIDVPAPPKLTVSGGGGSGAVLCAVVEQQAPFAITDVIIVQQGSGYTPGGGIPVSISAAESAEPDNFNPASGQTSYIPNGTAPPTPQVSDASLPAGNYVFITDDEVWSTIDWDQSTNGLGQVERDMSNGGAEPGDGYPIVLGGQRYTKGIGVHARSVVAIPLPAGKYSRFKATVGAEEGDPGLAGGTGSMSFSVKLNNVNSQPVAFTPVMCRPPAPADGSRRAIPVDLDVDVSSASWLFLVVDGGDDSNNDQGSWGHARLELKGSSGTSGKLLQCECTNLSTGKHRHVYADGTEEEWVLA